MTSESLLSKLERVKRTGAGRWIASCPAHEDKRPSVTIRELDDGRILLHCWAGCGALDILQALGLDWQAIMPDPVSGARQDHRMKAVRKAFPTGDVLACLEQEWVFLLTVNATLRRGTQLRHVDYQRLQLSGERIMAARSFGETRQRA